VEQVLKRIEKERDRSVGILEEFLRIPSISTSEENAGDVRKAAEYLADRFRDAGLPDVRIEPTAGHPVVYAEWTADPSAPTLLIYGHYDVQPIADPAEWTSPPFEPVIRDGKIWARGATDDKGQLLVHLLAAGAHLAVNDRLPVNVKFLIEGEEEIGSEHLQEFVVSNRERLACDAIAISDTAMYSPEVPSICTGLRGIAYTEFTLRGAATDLHSGSFGGAVDNPALALARVLASLKDRETGRVLVEGFYEGVEEPSDEERAAWAKLPASDARYLEMTGAPRLYGEEPYTLLERIWARPSLDVNGVWGGFTGQGSMTVLPARASAKVSMRLVPGQDPAAIRAKLKRHVERNLPDTVVLEKFLDLHDGLPWVSSLDHPAVKAAFRAVERGFGKKAVPTREGGSIPIVSMFTKELDAPAVLMGFGLHDEGAHGPDEHFDLGNMQAGIRSAACYLEELRHALAATG
jgi:acetylornithine deacetylase/succinyl-diaminopimelate desuccinylase-like protein